MWDKNENAYDLMSNPLSHTPENERNLKSYHTHPQAPPLFLFIICDLHSQCSISNNILGNDIITNIYFKYILFIYIWVWYNLIEKYEMRSCTPSLPMFATDFLLHPACNVLDGPLHTLL